MLARPVGLVPRSTLGGPAGPLVTVAEHGRGRPRGGSRTTIADHANARAAWRSRAAGVTLVLVLLSVSVFAVWASQATASAAADAAAANVLSDDYGDAARAVAAEESLERKYRVEPGPSVRVRFETSAEALTAALSRVRRDGRPLDSASVDQLVATHMTYLTGIGHLFDAVDRHQTALVLHIDAVETDPAFDVMEKAVLEASEAAHTAGLGTLARLQDIETLTRNLTPVVFLAGLLLAALLASITRGHRRLLVAEQARAVHDARHDSLTGLPNRNQLTERLDRALHSATATASGVGLLLVDLDRFKEINDTFGHHCGDQLLVQVARRIADEVRPGDTVARLSGDEFAVVLPGLAGVQDAVAAAATLRSALGTPFHVEGMDLDIEASVGVVLSGEHGEDPTTLLQHVGAAMYVAKRHGLGEAVYDPATGGHNPTRLAILGDLRRALQRGELLLHYQPKVDVASGDVTGAEALVRWNHPDRGLLVPDTFMPVAEHTGLISALTHYVLDAALVQTRIWNDQGVPRNISVNLSARNLLDERLPDQVAELLTAHRVPPELLTLEVTESAIVTEPLRAQRLLARLSAIGVGISIDDFGAGYTSLGQLRTLPVDELKIDRSFVTTMAHDHSNAVIVRSVIDLGHNLQLSIVAEGVEDSQTLDTLASFGCDTAQGYHLSRPLAAEAFDAWCSRRETRPGSRECAEQAPPQQGEVPVAGSTTERGHPGRTTR